MQAIADWLINGTYDKGVRLYELHGQNAFLKQKFKAGANDYNVPKLREELSRLAPVEQKAESKKLKAETTPAPVTATAAIATADHAKKYLQLTNKKTKLYLQLNMLMEQKHHLPEGEDLRKCCVAILNTNQQVMECWAAIDYYQEHQCFPDDEPAKAPIEPKKEMQLLRQTISKANTRLASPSCRNREQTQKLVAESKDRLAVLVADRKKQKA